MFSYNDQLLLSLKSGSGGAGCVSFFSKRVNPRGGPDGGDGGAGGSLFFVSSPRYTDFKHLKKKKKYQAAVGQAGGPQLKKGRKGKDLVLSLPLGTLVKNSKGQILKDFQKTRKEFFLEGGRGGRGNAFFKTSLNQAPWRFQKGEKGKLCKVILELKPIVQIAVIGKVNTGKSSFFNLVTKARSKVASYPYTTVSPHIGQMKHFDKPCLIMDIPGLEKGASISLAKGLSFLRSIQRAELLLHFIDSACSEFLEDRSEIEKEMQVFDDKYDEPYFTKLSQKKMFLIFTKVDELKTDHSFYQFVKKMKIKKNQKVFLLSNKTKQGLKEILSAIEKII